MTRRVAELVVSASVGYPRFLNGPNDAMYWSAFKDDDERDGGPEGAATYATPEAAVRAVTLNIGRLVIPPEVEAPEFEALAS